MRQTKEEFYMNIAKKVLERSSCTRLHVGALILNEEMTQIISMGYNGNVKGGSNKCDSTEPGNCGCIHAEVNALIKPRPNEGKVMVVTHSPCKACSKLIVNAGIEKVYYGTDYRIPDGLNLLKKHKIKIVKV